MTVRVSRVELPEDMSGAFLGVARGMRCNMGSTLFPQARRAEVQLHQRPEFAPEFAPVRTII